MEVHKLQSGSGGREGEKRGRDAGKSWELDALHMHKRTCACWCGREHITHFLTNHDLPPPPPPPSLLLQHSRQTWKQCGKNVQLASKEKNNCTRINVLCLGSNKGEAGIGETTLLTHANLLVSRQSHALICGTALISRVSTLIERRLWLRVLTSRCWCRFTGLFEGVLMPLDGEGAKKWGKRSQKPNLETNKLIL